MNTSILPTTLTASEARANIYKILEEVDRKSRRFKITHKGKVKAVVMSEEVVEGWEETQEIMINKKLMKDIKQGEKDYRAGKFYTWEHVQAEILKKTPRKSKK